MIIIIKRTAEKNTFCIDCSTIDIDASKNLAKLCEAKSISFTDAPVSGGVTGAEAATLTFMIGTKQNNFDHVKTLLEGMGKNFVHVGDNGHGLAAKICNNMLLGIEMIGVSEAMNLGIR
jgi:3-hydroxyisobutyrate dehydrogenase